MGTDLRTWPFLVLLAVVPLRPSQDPLQALLAKVQRAEQEQNLDEAATLYKEILELRPHWTAAEFNLATIYYSQKKYPEAILLFDDLLTKNHSLADAYLFRGVSYYELGDYVRAVASLRKFCSLKPQDPQIHFFLGAVYYELGDYANAVLQDLQQVRIGSDEDRAYYYLGKAYQALADEALQRLKSKPGGEQKALADTLRPEGPDCQPAKGLSDGLIFAACLHVSDDLPASTMALLEARRRAPGDEEVTLWSSSLYRYLAESSYAKLVARSPNSPLAALLRAQSLEWQGKRPEAERTFQRAIELSDSDSEPLISYGEFKDKIGQFADAIPLFQKALALDPFNLRATALLGEAYVMTQQPQQALAYLARVVQSNPKDAQSRIYFAEAYEALGRLPDAIKTLEQAGNDEDGRIHYLLGKYYLRQGQKAKADQAFATFQRLQAARKKEYGRSK